MIEFEYQPGDIVMISTELLSDVPNIFEVLKHEYENYANWYDLKRLWDNAIFYDVREADIIKIECEKAA